MNWLDRIIRLIVSIIAFYFALKGGFSNELRIIVSIIGGLLLVTSVVGFCPLYKMFGISTSKKSDNS